MNAAKTRSVARKRFGWLAPKPNGGLDVSIQQHVLTEREWREFRYYTAVVEDLRPPLVDYLALGADYCDVADVARSAAADLDRRFLTGIADVGASIDAQASAQRRVTNFLGAASAFRDRATARLARRHGKESLHSEAIRAKTIEIYDGSFAYRVLYNLRHHAQHFENPISVIPINADRSVVGTMVTSVALLLDPAVLAANGKLNRKVRHELAALGSRKIELRPLLLEYWGAHQRLMLTLIELEKSRLAEMAHYAAELYRAFEIPHDATPVVWEGGHPRQGPQSQSKAHLCGFDELYRLTLLGEEISSAILSNPLKNDC